MYRFFLKLTRDKRKPEIFCVNSRLNMEKPSDDEWVSLNLSFS